jgi:hypothetical protein
MTKRDEVLRGGLATMGITFNREMTAALADVYWNALQVLTEAELTRAFARALTECKFFPVPAELLTFAGRGPRDVGADAIEAWGAVRRAIDVHDWNHSVDFGPLVNAVVRNLGGWRELCDLKLPDLDVWARKRFTQTYAAFADKDPGTLNGAPLMSATSKVYRIPIGSVLPPLALPAPPSAVADIVRELVDGPPAPTPRMPTEPPVLAPAKPKAPPMTDAAVEARKAEIARQMAEWQAKQATP